MKAVVEAVGGVKDENILKKSWRSRPLLVETVNAIFTGHLPNYHPNKLYSPPPIPIRRRRPKASCTRSIIGISFRKKKPEKLPGGGWFEQALALQIRQLLREKNVVYDKKTKQYHPLQPAISPFFAVAIFRARSWPKPFIAPD